MSSAKWRQFCLGLNELGQNTGPGIRSSNKLQWFDQDERVSE